MTATLTTKLGNPIREDMQVELAAHVRAFLERPIHHGNFGTLWQREAERAEAYDLDLLTGRVQPNRTWWWNQFDPEDREASIPRLYASWRAAEDVLAMSRAALDAAVEATAYEGGRFDPKLAGVYGHMLKVCAICKREIQPGLAYRATGDYLYHYDC